MEKFKNEKCIYIKMLTRDKNIAFEGKINYFGGNLIMLKPKKSNLNLEKIVEYFNKDYFKINFLYSGRFKIGHKQLSDVSIDKKYLQYENNSII